jgi:hypothetical protein
MSTDFNTMAQTLFGSTTPTSQTDHGAAFRAELAGTAPMRQLPEHEPRTEEEMADAMFGESDPALQFGDAMRAIESAAMENLADPDDAADTARYWGEAFTALGLTHRDAMEIAELGISAMSTPATPEVVTMWTEQARDALLMDYGPKGARQALDDARRYIELHAGPDLREVLNLTGLGSHPTLVRIAAARARTARMSGLLR